MKNWYETFSFSPERVLVLGAEQLPGIGEAEKVIGHTPIERTVLAAEVKRAESAGLAVRGIGSGWSSGDVMATGGVGVLTLMGRVLAYAHRGHLWRSLSPVLGALRPEVAKSDRRFVHVDAGITIHALIHDMAKAETHGGATRSPWCIPSVGGSSGQTLAGAISTATHGGAFDRPPLADSVRAIRLIAPGGVEHWIEPGGEEAIFGSLSKELPGVQAHHDDELFRAALVAVRSLGLITEFVIEVVEMSGQSQCVVPTTWDDVKAALLDNSLFTSATALGARPPGKLRGKAVHPHAEGFEILINPYRSDDDYEHGAFTRRCVAVMRARADGIPDDGSVDRSGDDGFLKQAGWFLRIETGGPGEFRDIVDELIGVKGPRRERPVIGRYLPTPAVLETYAGGGKPTPGLSIEVAMTTAGNAHLAMMDDIFAAFDDLIRKGKKYAGFFSMRFTRPSRAFLAMQHIDAADASTRVCHLELFALKELFWGTPQNDGNAEGGTEHFLRAFVAAAEKRGARLHWRQMHHLDRQRIAADYSAHGLHAWRRARTRLSRSGSWRTFSNSFSRRVGLESYHEAIAATSSATGRVELFAYAGARLRQLTIAGDHPGDWTPIKVDHDEEIASGLTAVVTSTGAVDVYAETDRHELLRLRSTGGTWSAKRMPDAGTVDDGIAGPWAAAVSGGTTHLLATDPRGHLRWVRIDGADQVSGEVVVPSLPKGAGRFLSQIAVCADGAGHLHVVGVSSQRQLIRGRHDASGWTWGALALKPRASLPIVIAHEAPPAVVAHGVDHLMVFAVSGGQAYRLSGIVSDVLWAWDEHNTIARRTSSRGCSSAMACARSNLRAAASVRSSSRRSSTSCSTSETATRPHGAAAGRGDLDRDPNRGGVLGTLGSRDSGPALRARVALALLDRVVERLRGEYESADRAAWFDRLKDQLTGQGAGSYAELAAVLHSTEGAVRVAVHRLRRRYRELLREEVARTLDDDGDVDDELCALMSAVMAAQT